MNETETISTNSVHSVSVIIPSYNSHHTIGKTLEGILNQSALEALREIIVVDSSDDDITHDFLKSKEDKLIKVTRSGYRVIPAIQRNIGGKMAQGDLLCFVDSDAYPHKDWVKTILEAYDRGHLAGGGSYRVPDFQHNMAIAYAQYFLEFSEFIGYGKEQNKSIIASCNIFCDRRLFEKVEGFPEIRASEDSLFSLKINRTNHMRYLPGAIVYHIFRENKSHFLSNQRMLGKYIYIFRRKSYNTFYYRGLMPYLFFPAFLTFKFIRIFLRVLRTNFNNFIQFIKATPLLLRGMMAWGSGFISGVKEYRKQSEIVNKA